MTDAPLSPQGPELLGEALGGWAGTLARAHLSTTLSADRDDSEPCPSPERLCSSVYVAAMSASFGAPQTGCPSARLSLGVRICAVER